MAELFAKKEALKLKNPMKEIKGINNQSQIECVDVDYMANYDSGDTNDY